GATKKRRVNELLRKASINLQRQQHVQEHIDRHGTGSKNQSMCVHDPAIRWITQMKKFKFAYFNSW
ncbi:MAG TPA: hypothetical protein VF172_04690, partial [Nitrososphaera sp.]